MDMKNLSKNWSSNRRGKAFDALLGSPFSLLHCFLCIAALILGFRLSREALLVVGSHKPSHDTFRSMRRAYTDAIFHTDVALGLPYVKDDRRNLTRSVPPVPPAVGLKSSRVHVGRHEILIRSWPHPDPVQTFLAHQLLSHVQDEQQRIFGLKEKKQLLVITPTSVHIFQALHFTSLIHTLRAISSPLIWIVVEAGGVSSETAALIVDSQLPYHHLGIDASILDGKDMQQVETLSRLEGLRFIGKQQLDGVVLFVDESNIYSIDYFDEAQKVDWIGFFPVGLLSPPGSSGLLIEFTEAVQDQFNLSRETLAEQGLDELDASRASKTHFKGDISSLQKEDSGPRFVLPLQTPVCNSSGHVIGWYSPSPSKNGSGMAFEWTGFALNARILWEGYERPIWINDWAEAFGQSQFSLRSPLAFVRDASFVQPLGNCGKDALMWWLRVEACADSKFPPRWMISPPLDVVVPSKHTPWPEAPPPPPPLTPPPVFSDEHVIIRGNGTKRRKGKGRSHRAKRDKSKKIFSQVLGRSTVGR